MIVRKKHFKSKYLLSVALALGTVFCLVGIKQVSTVTTAHADTGTDYVVLSKSFDNCAGGSDNSSSSDSNKSNNNSSGGNSSLAGISAEGQKNIKPIYEYLHGQYGLSGCAVAGILGNWVQESQIRPEALEANGNGHGMGQWSFGRATALENFAKSKGKDWKDLNIQLEFMCTQDSGAGWLKQYANQASDDDASGNALLFQRIWERSADGAGPLSNRAQKAKEIWDYMKKNGMDGKKDPSKIAKIAGNASGTDNSATSGNQDSTTKSDCGDGSGDGDSADGTGSIGHYRDGQRWSRDNVPADVKKYIHDPEKAGLHWASPQGWCDPGGECVNFSVSYFHALWKGAPTHISGNGKDMANNGAAAMGGSPSKTPHAGAICSEVSPNVSAAYGHTYVVEHVLANGDIICAEQNYPPLSGDLAGKVDTWDFFWESKSYYTKYVQFWTPKSGKPNWDGGSK